MSLIIGNFKFLLIILTLDKPRKNLNKIYLHWIENEFKDINNNFLLPIHTLKMT